MRWLTRHWYASGTPLLIYALLPLEWLFWGLTTLRRGFFRWGWCSIERLPVPVVVVGNIHVGGTGKTPLTLSLIKALTARHVRVGVVSRGYGGKHHQPLQVQLDSSAAEVGDEALLLAQSGVPVVVGKDRVAAARYLLAKHSAIELIISDDGLQHYHLGRDMEIVVLDSQRGWGNGRLLPCGPLREPVSRLQTVQALVCHGNTLLVGLPENKPRFEMNLSPTHFCSLNQQIVSIAEFVAQCQGLQIAAMAGIGHPERFFTTLRGLGIHLNQAIAKEDHCVYDENVIRTLQVDRLIVTTKDAVKLNAVIKGDKERAKLWILPVEAQLEPNLAEWLLDAIALKPDRAENHLT